jgi:uncharacterized protein
MGKVQCFKKGIQVFAVLLIAACVDTSDMYQTIQLVAPDGKVIAVRVEVADEPAQLSKGLMHRKILEEGTGMLFVFAEERLLSFWMKNTLLPLDVLFFSAEGSFVSWASMEPCSEDPCALYTSKATSRYALEVPLGFVEQYGIRAGWNIVLE